jgi:hypothetical protein
MRLLRFLVVLGCLLGIGEFASAEEKNRAAVPPGVPLPYPNTSPNTTKELKPKAPQASKSRLGSQEKSKTLSRDN